MTALETIIEYAVAHNEAEDNPRLLCQDYARNYDLCVERMKRVSRADQALFLLDREGLPEEVSDFFVAKDDPGCSSCWVSSSRKKGHMECEKKIDRYFKTRDALIKLGMSLHLLTFADVVIT